jgi:WW domain-containing oxidoreductase
LANSITHGARSTANQVLAGIDLTRKCFLVTGCNTGIGFETMNALAANGARVIGLARSIVRARIACDKVGLCAIPVACDLADLDSVAAAVKTIRSLQTPLDAIITNAGVANPSTLQTRYEVELQFLVNHVGHFYLVNQLLDRVRNGTGRIVMVSGSASVTHAPPEGIMFDNLDGHLFYDPMIFYGQSKLAVALYAKELSRLVYGRGIAVNSLHPGATRGTGLRKSLGIPFMKSTSQGAATQALLAASPQVAGITGEYWSDCQIADGNPLLSDSNLARRLWEASAQIVAANDASQSHSTLAIA